MTTRISFSEQDSDDPFAPGKLVICKRRDAGPLIVLVADASDMPYDPIDKDCFVGVQVVNPVIHGLGILVVYTKSDFEPFHGTITLESNL